jgi:hypothetical protein
MIHVSLLILLLLIMLIGVFVLANLTTFIAAIAAYWTANLVMRIFFKKIPHVNYYEAVGREFSDMIPSIFIMKYLFHTHFGKYLLGYRKVNIAPNAK